MANEKIKEYAKQNHVKMWQIANRMGYKQDGTLSRKMRLELDEDKKREMLKIIDELAAERKQAISEQIRQYTK